MGYTVEDIRGRNRSMFDSAEVSASDQDASFWNVSRQGGCQAGELKKMHEDKREIGVYSTFTPGRNRQSL